MELMQLEMFVAVVEEGSVRGAAERVFRTQPAVSLAVLKLEKEIGGPVFDRSKLYRYRLTQLGESLYSYATRILALRNEANVALEDIRNLRAGRLRVGANESISLYLLPRLTQEFLERYRSIQIELRCDSSARLLADLKDRKLDLALLSFEPKERELESHFIMQDEMVLIVNPDHPFATQVSVDTQNLGSEPVIVMDVSSAWHKSMVEEFARLKAPLNLRVENAPIETIKKMVEMRLGAGFVPLMCVREERARGELAVLALDGFHQERSLYVVRRRAVQSHAALAFAQVAVSFGEALLKGKQTVLDKNRSYKSASHAKQKKLLLLKQRA
ncbi:MAG: LysR substrate-binding domain-containing protein [Candidatus Acidiferrales bacterium]